MPLSIQCSQAIAPELLMKNIHIQTLMKNIVTRKRCLLTESASCPTPVKTQSTNRNTGTHTIRTQNENHRRTNHITKDSGIDKATAVAFPVVGAQGKFLPIAACVFLDFVGPSSGRSAHTALAICRNPVQDELGPTAIAAPHQSASESPLPCFRL